MNIQLIQLISTKLLYAHFISVFDDIQAQIFLTWPNFFVFFFEVFFCENTIVEHWPSALLL